MALVNLAILPEVPAKAALGETSTATTAAAAAEERRFAWSTLLLGVEKCGVYSCGTCCSRVR